MIKSPKNNSKGQVPVYRGKTLIKHSPKNRASAYVTSGMAILKGKSLDQGIILNTKKKYRDWGSMKGAVEIKVQINKTALKFLEKWRDVRDGSSVGLGAAIEQVISEYQHLRRPK